MAKTERVFLEFVNFDVVSRWLGFFFAFDFFEIYSIVCVLWFLGLMAKSLSSSLLHYRKNQPATIFKFEMCIDVKLLLPEQYDRVESGKHNSE